MKKRHKEILDVLRAGGHLSFRGFGSDYRLYAKGASFIYGPSAGVRTSTVEEMKKLGLIDKQNKPIYATP